MLFIGDVRRILVIPDHVDDDDVGRCLDAAKKRAANAGIKERTNDPLYDQFILFLADLYYDNIAMDLAASGKDPAKIQDIINGFVWSLRYSDGDDDG